MTVDEIQTIANDPTKIVDTVVLVDTVYVVLIVGEPSLKGNPPSLAQGEPYRHYRGQLLDQRAWEQLRNALQNEEVKKTLASLANSLDQVGKRLRQRLIEVGIRAESRLISVFVHAFQIFTMLTAALSPKDDRWYCDCYGLRLICTA